MKLPGLVLGCIRLWLFLLPFGLFAPITPAQTNAPIGWIWAGGNATLVPDNGKAGDVGRPGVYGMLGVSTPTNMPGARDSAATWTDRNGNFWMFGGNGYDAADGVGLLNDLWEFNTSTLQWTWIGGSSTLLNDASSAGQPGVYGTLGTAAPGNIPGARMGAITWTDNTGKLWLFGGEGYATVNGFTGSTSFNDLWEFDPSTRLWAWMGGSDQVGITSSYQPAIYGTKGMPAAQNNPGSRYSMAGWTDSAGNFWLFGGNASNDLWKFNPSTGLWVWMSGSPGTPAQPGVYGTMGVADPTNVPGTRENPTSWTDSSGNFWLLGGVGYDAGITDTNNVGLLNDLWKFTPATNEWTWVGGSNTLPCNGGCGEDGVYGTLGVPSPQNAPGGRKGGAHWTDTSGNLWLFAGSGFAASGPEGSLDDLWEFTPSTEEWTWQGGNIQAYTGTPTCAGPQTSPAPYPGIYGTLGVAASANIPGSRGGIQTWVGPTGDLWLFGGYGADANGCLGDLNDLWTYQFSAGRSSLIAAIPVVSPAAGTYTTPQSVAITDATPGALIYYTTDGTAPTATSTPYNGPVAVSASETIQATALAPGYFNSSIAAATYTINLPPPDFAIALSSQSLTIAAGHSASDTVSITPSNAFDAPVSFTCSGLPSGAICSFSPSTLTPSGTLAMTTLSVASSAGTASSSSTTSNRFPGWLAMGLCFFCWDRRRRLRVISLPGVLVMIVGLQLLSGCGGGSTASAAPKPPVTSSVTVTAVSGNLQHTSTFTLTINE